MGTGLDHIFKIVSRAQWAEAERSGIFEGAPVDRTDGFIHFSTADQVEATAAKHFAGQRDMLLVAVDPERLDALRWEVSRGDALFPHLYAALPVSDVAWVAPLPFVEGRHAFDGLLG